MSLKSRDLSAMQNCVCFNLRYASRAFTQFYFGKLNRHNLLPTQTPILSALSSAPSATMSDLSDWLGMDRTTLIRNLGPLERDGLVTVIGKGRGSKVSVEITAKGKAAMAKLLPDWRAAQKAVVETLGEERWAEILNDLERAAQALE